jgi:hypothetical protein
MVPSTSYNNSTLSLQIKNMPDLTLTRQDIRPLGPFYIGAEDVCITLLGCTCIQAQQSVGRGFRLDISHVCTRVRPLQMPSTPQGPIAHRTHSLYSLFTQSIVLQIGKEMHHIPPNFAVINGLCQMSSVLMKIISFTAIVVTISGVDHKYLM